MATDQGSRARLLVPRLLLLVAVILAPFLLLGGPAQFTARSWSTVWNLGHAVLFYCLVGGVLGVRPQPQKSILLTAAAAVTLTFLAAGVVELVQGVIGRERSLLDVWVSLAGAVLGILYAPTSSATQRPRGMVTSAARPVITSVLVVALAAPASAALFDEWRARKGFPVLSDFASSLELERWDGGGISGLEAGVPAEHNGAMLVRFDPEGGGAFHLTHFPPDWSGYRFLVLRLENRGEPIKMTCRVHDLAHDLATPHESSDHYDEHFELLRGWQEIRIDGAERWSSGERTT